MTIGGAERGEKNVISANEYGIYIAPPSRSEGVPTSASNNVITGNYIGTGSDGTSELGNSAAGIMLFDGGIRDEQAENDRIGGISSGAGNAIADSGDNGIGISGENAIANNILGNSIFSNAALGIDLE